jgi:hypothetical protein
VNRNQAKQILIAYRPDIDDDSDPEIREALALADQDLELKAWLENQRAVQSAIRDEFGKIVVPPDLRGRILAGRKIVQPIWRRREFLAAAAAVAVLSILSAFWFRPSEEDESFAAFRSRMVRFAVREYRMDIVTTNATQVRQYLAAQGAPSDYSFPRNLSSRPVIGGAKLSWQGHSVAMVCLEAPTNETLYVFVLDQAVLRNGTAPGATPEIVSLHRLNAAGWSSGNRVYLVAANLAESELRKFLNGGP